MSSQAWQTIFQIALAVGILLTAVGTFGAYYFGQRIEREKDARAAYAGEIKSKDQVLVSGKARVWPQLEFGHSGAILAFAGPEGSPLFKFADDANLTIIREDGRVKVSVGIRDNSGHLVAELVKNEWRVNPQKAFDRNYSADALEVRDPSGDVVLQVRALPDRVQLQAKFYDSTGRGIGFGTMVGPQGPGGALEITGPAHPQLQLRIAPMFRYPSDAHLGELVGSPK